MSDQTLTHFQPEISQHLSFATTIMASGSPPKCLFLLYVTSCNEISAQMHKVQPNAVNTTSDRPTDFRRQHHAHSRSRFGVNNLKIWIKKEMKVHFSIAICIDSVAFWKASARERASIGSPLGLMQASATCWTIFMKSSFLRCWIPAAKVHSRIVWSCCLHCYVSGNSHCRVEHKGRGTECSAGASWSDVIWLTAPRLR